MVLLNARREENMRKKTILAVPSVCFWAVICVCVLGIAIGSFFDVDISRAIADVTTRGNYFAMFSPILAYAMLPAGGTCLYVGLKKKGDSFQALARLLLVFSWFMAVYYTDGYFGEKVRTTFGYIPGESSVFHAIAIWLIWAVLYALVPLIMLRLLDDSNPDKLIVVGMAILTAGIAADAVMQWFKQIGSRPRFKYLLTLEDPMSEFRNWWQMIPYLASKNDSFQSWPSGHMSIVGILFALPLLTDCMKKKSDRLNLIAFIFACAFVILCGYNRIHMTNHFLSDVSFGTLNTFLITSGICTVYMKVLEKKTSRT
jgi:hypothetical protein